MSLVRRNGFSRPWPEGEPTRRGERCSLSDLLITECACRVHEKKEKDDDHTAEPLDLDFG